MRILYLGDVVGKSGRDYLTKELPLLRVNLSIDFVVVCGENAAHGFGITEKICNNFYQSGVDVITLGNHAWDKKEIIPYINKSEKLLRPLNLIEGTPGIGLTILDTEFGRVGVANLMTNLFVQVI